MIQKASLHCVDMIKRKYASVERLLFIVVTLVAHFKVERIIIECDRGT